MSSLPCIPCSFLCSILRFPMWSLPAGSSLFFWGPPDLDLFPLCKQAPWRQPQGSVDGCLGGLPPLSDKIFKSGTFRIGCHLPLHAVRFLLLPRMAGKAPLGPCPFGIVPRHDLSHETGIPRLLRAFRSFAPGKEAPSRLCDAPCALPDRRPALYILSSYPPEPTQ